MYAIFETGGKQYKVAAGDTVRVEKLPDEKGAKIEFDKVLVVNHDDETLIGTPYLDAATVNATVTDVGKGEKIVVFKFKAKKNYRRKQGHRQPFTEVEIESVSVGGKIVLKKEEPKKADKVTAGDDAIETAEIKAETETAETEAETETAETEAETETAETEAETETAKLETEKPADDKADDDAKIEKAEKTDKSDKAAAPKMTKSDIMAKLDELGASYAKSAKKDELLAILAEAENSIDKA
jgi:large subunit ribosomal protein L21